MPSMPSGDKTGRRYLLVFALIAAQVSGMSLADRDGGITADSANYLRLAANMDRKGPLYTPDLYGEDGFSFFSVWPVGYPVIIAAVHHGLGIEVAAASKLANLLLLGLGVLLFRWMFPRTGHYYGSLFLLGTVANITYMTWSEVPFLVAGTALCMGLTRYPETGSAASALLVGGAALAMFLLRYVGLFAVVPVGLAGLHLLVRGRRRRGSILVGIALGVLAVAGAYLAMNRSMSGHLTGTPRVPAPESDLSLARDFLRVQLKEFRFPLIGLAAAQVAAGWRHRSWLWNLPRSPEGREGGAAPSDRRIWPACLLVGLCYLAAVTTLRWAFLFDAFGPRLFALSTYLLLLGGVNALLRGSPAGPARVWSRRGLVLVVAVSLLYFFPVKRILRDPGHYLETRARLVEAYRTLPDSSLILLDPGCSSLYLTMTLQPAGAYPFCRDTLPFGSAADAGSFVDAQCEASRGSAVFLDLSGLEDRDLRREFLEFRESGAIGKTSYLLLGTCR